MIPLRMLVGPPPTTSSSASMRSTKDFVLEHKRKKKTGSQ